MDTIAVIINKMAQNSAKAILYLDGLKSANISYILYEATPKNLPATIKKCIKKYKIILIGGGDGTIRTAAHYCAHTSVILGVIPLGTLNHFAKEQALPSDVKDIVTSLKKSHTIKIDLAAVNDIIFINNSSIGFYPKFADKRDQYNKSYNKWLSYIPGFIQSFKKHPVFSLTVKSKNLDLSFHTSFLMVSNNVYSYKFPATIKRDSFQKALLGLYYFKQGKIQLFKIIQSLFFSKNLFEKIQSKHPIEIHFNNEKEIKISVDGDTIKTKTPLYYRTLPRSLTLLKSSS
ncbi:diacylglycerol kinase family protein [Legionella resiliens]|uniref:Diacylglycerol kinase n=1 Tax=Legionella resiliens TaxID=2905958 RepID=A0ABS8X658_9GAMM|nr:MULTISPECIES: diacylglycerol kinase family protein [unclassified Legionella]MCE0723591.1 diacylglycerol kinase [Legionella sp. 9fVS26]MCE3532745.1 diacylglycerol kinase [Legionella sp. 8cVS16]